MDRRDIEVFVTVMQLGSVSAAARMLDMAQPSVSKAIALIEHRHQLALFERHRGRLRPTEAAQQLYGEATRISEELSRFDRLVDMVRQLRPGLVRIAATPSLSLGVLPVVAGRYRQRHGEQALILDMHPNHDIAAAVARRQYDLGLMVHAGTEPPEDMRVLSRGAIVCVFPKGDPLGGAAEVRAEDIAARDLIAVSTDIGIVGMLTRNVPGFDRRTSRTLETNRYNIAVNLVRRGLGITLVDEFTMFGMQEEGVEWRPFAPQLDVTLLAAVAETSPPRPEIERVLALLAELGFPPATAG